MTGIDHRHRPSAPEGKVITVFAAKGGCGKTTVATNLAFALAKGGRYEVCVLDLDLAFGDVAIALQLMPSRTIVDAVQMGESIDEMGVRSLVTRHSPGVDTILAPMEPGEAERVDVAVVAHLLRMLRRMYRYVVIDTPPAFSEHVLSAFDQSDAVRPAHDPRRAGAEEPPPHARHARPARVPALVLAGRAATVPTPRSASPSTRSRRRSGHPVAAQIPSSRAVSASINKGAPLVVDDPMHPVSNAVHDIADLLQERLQSAASAEAAARRRRYG